MLFEDKKVSVTSCSLGTARHLCSLRVRVDHPLFQPTEIPIWRRISQIWCHLVINLIVLGVVATLKNVLVIYPIVQQFFLSFIVCHFSGILCFPSVLSSSCLICFVVTVVTFTPNNDIDRVVLLITVSSGSQEMEGSNHQGIHHRNAQNNYRVHVIV